MPRDKPSRHAVWDVYDQFRTARLSCKYYAAKLAQHERTNLTIEIVLAATASGSAIAALTFWQTNEGKVAWTGLSFLSAILALAKPLLKLTERIQKFEELAVAYSLLEHDYKKLEIAIRQKGTFGAELRQQLRFLMDRADTLKQKEVIERQIDEKLRFRCREAVEKELPKENFFVPEE